MRKILLNLFIGILWVAGNLTPFLFLWLTWPRVLPIEPFTHFKTNPLVLDFALALVFPLQHSIWTQPPIKRKLASILGEYFERPMYVLTSGIAVALTAILWQSAEETIWAFPNWTLWPLRTLFLALIGTQIYCSTLLGAKFLTGIAHIKALKLARPLRPIEFKEIGPYRRIRHPIAASQICMLWITPVMHSDRFLLALLWTLWIVLVTFLEDQRLAEQFGNSHAEYRRRAGFLWPRVGRAQL